MEWPTSPQSGGCLVVDMLLVVDLVKVVASAADQTLAV
jgi:hypothetical protein